MLSTTLQQYTPVFSQVPSASMVSHDQQHQRMPAHHLNATDLDPLAHNSPCALQFQQHARHASANAPRSAKDMAPTRPGRGSTDGAPVRRRISRACDQCNQLRTKCDGKSPCAHCVESGLTCEYIRERKKRGKASRKDIAAQQAATAAAAAAAASTTDSTRDSPRSRNEFNGDRQSAESSGCGERSAPIRRISAALPPPRPTPLGSKRTLESTGMYAGPGHIPPRTMSLSAVEGVMENGIHRMRPSDHVAVNMPTPRLQAGEVEDRGMPLPMTDYGPLDEYHRNMMQNPQTEQNHQLLHGHSLAHQIMPTNMQAYGDAAYNVLSPTSHQPPPNAFRIPTGQSPMSNFLGASPVAGSPGWLSLSSPTAALFSHPPPPATTQTLRYPVLQPLLPHLGSIIPVSLACDLLDLYFQSSSYAFMQPVSPYVLGYVFRKRSFLRPNNPRACSPALLASMLWVGAQTSESPYLTSPPSARGRICQQLLELTIGLLNPLIHTPASVDGSASCGANSVSNGVALGGFGVAIPGRAQETERGSPGTTAALDDVATYLHLAVVVSASEYKAASLRWWNAAWSLARELKLGRELPPNSARPSLNGGDEADARGEVEMDLRLGNGPEFGRRGNRTDPSAPLPPGMVSEEEREERRRIWWLLYTMDRHLALCYNRPLFLLDVECDGLFQPVDDSIWQAGDYYTGENLVALSDPSSPYFRRRGPTFECSGHSIFGFFTPLMTILGGIIDLNHARNHPRFGFRFRNGSDWDELAGEITQQLQKYGHSLQEFEARATALATESNETDKLDIGTPSVHSVNSSSSRLTESILQTKMVVAYATHLMHTMHILLNGKWDPIALLDDADLWISSQSFIEATSHAVSAAEAIDQILAHDPDLSFMPFFFGIYLLQGSFLLLLIADKLQGEASPSVVRACESIVRAHEACVVTLNTEYQRNFRKVMRSALAQVRGRCIEDFGEQQLRRREVLSLYRWTGDGTGLAL